ncbi:MAG: chemotaxis protein CheC [Rhodoferax sp.]|nr:chemotaxis protein CheC [Rhodoferax sp.]NCP55056.1 chemotaxis protein CheC [Rhodoferax sp.]PIW07150.1 MAG: chemotaxis protein CheC [Comamonadaceae bacterium CG17_big_fil_post_rev_8_21_14_2_50_60_13]PIY22917.1 MAG: chemotaxis protein CheC [Comamonadaceae bacterium CG_4_10_14_3_um_filter_60_75]PJC19509.1 MAG: chemotaxis protein CheC [Comamonadaceae bacterium CG_4_9_14_0_8_um_filter_60_18]
MTLTELELDALVEVFNVGVGQAASALSQLAGDTVRLNVPKVEMLTKQGVSSELTAQGAGRICAVKQEFSGVLNTEAVLMFPVQQSLQLVQMMVGDDVPLEQLGEMEQEALAEIGNILLNSVVSGVADVLKLRFEGSLPCVALGPVQDVLGAQGSLDDMVLSLQIDFAIDALEIQGFLVFMLDVESVASLKSTVRAFLESLS